MVLAGTVGKDHILIRRLRTLTFGFLTPFYFIRAGSLVSVPALIGAKMLSKMIPLAPTMRAFNYLGHEGMYYSLMMSDRVDVRHHLRAVRAESSDYRSDAVFAPGSHGNCKRGGADGDRERVFHAQAPVAGRCV